MVEYALVLINRYLVGKDGKTAYERFRGKKSKMLGFEFGESVHFWRIPLQARIGKFYGLWQTDSSLDIGRKVASVHGGQQRGSFQDEDDEEDT